MTPEAQEIIREVHPEVCFWAMAGETPLPFPKKTKEGQQARERVLISAGLPTAFVREKPSVRVGQDDFLDACAAVWTAARIARGLGQRLPKRIERDAKGLDQAIWY